MCLKRYINLKVMCQITVRTIFWGRQRASHNGLCLTLEVQLWSQYLLLDINDILPIHARPLGHIPSIHGVPSLVGVAQEGSRASVDQRAPICHSLDSVQWVQYVWSCRADDCCGSASYLLNIWILLFQFKILEMAEKYKHGVVATEVDRVAKMYSGWYYWSIFPGL